MNDIIEYRERFASLNPTFRVGIVQQQDTARAKVRVVFPDYDEMISWWLPIVFPKTQNDKAYWIPDIGEQVVCLMDLRDEAGAVLGAIYSDADAPPVNSADNFISRSRTARASITIASRTSSIFFSRTPRKSSTTPSCICSI